MQRPTLLYDGDCEFCQYCVDYLKQRTEETVRYQPYQQGTLGRPFEACQKAIQLVVSEAQFYQGAAAGFKTLSYGHSNRGWWLYKHLPGFAWTSEKIYLWISCNRTFCHSIAKALCGNPWQVGWLTFVFWGMTFVVLGLTLLL